MTKKQLIIIIIILVLGAAVAVFFRYQDIQKEKQLISEAGKGGKLSSMISERNRLEKEKYDLIRKNNGKYIGPFSFVFSEPASALAKGVVAAFEKYGYTGEIAVSSKYYPGNKGCITKEQMKQFIKDGWQVVLNYDENTDDIVALCNSVKRDFGQPKAVYLPETNKEISSSALDSMGINTVVRYGAGAGYNVKGDPNSGKYKSDIFATGCNESTRVENREKIMLKGECFVYILGFKNVREHCKDFKQWAKSLDKTASDEGFSVVPISKVKAIVEKNRKGIANTSPKAKKEVQKLNKQIKELQAKIKKLEKKYEKDIK